MKILLITENVGRTAPGIVFERLIQGLSITNTVDVLTADFDSSLDLNKVSKIIKFKKRYVHPRISKLLISLFTINPFDYLWAREALKKGSVLKGEYDVVLSFLSFHHYSSMIAGKMIAEKIKCKFGLLCVDAIPAPLGWPENASYRKGVLRMMSKYLSAADIFFSSNIQMLDYQLQTFRAKSTLLADVAYTPSYGKFVNLSAENNETNNFVYTGGIYGARKPEYVLKGFEKLLKIHPESKLIFVGGTVSQNSLLNLEKSTLDKIEIVGFTKDLSEIYKNATALIDIDADIENDVFLSSKITNYLLVNRVIISETGVKSPSRHLFKNIDSIIQCDHDSNQICAAMLKSIGIKKTIDFGDRRDVIELFSLNNVVNCINRNLISSIQHNK